jgi:drug/metabolite transporter (DMT)-like permease
MFRFSPRPFLLRDAAGALKLPTVTSLPNTCKQFSPKQWSPQKKGLFAGLLAAFFLGLMGFLVHLGGHTYPSQQLLFFRALIGLALLLPSHWSRIHLFFTPSYAELWVRALTGTASVMILFYNLSHIGAASATLLLDMSVLYLVLLSWAFSGEKLQGLQWLCLGFILAGNVLLNMGGNPIPSFNLMLGLFGAFLAAVSFWSLRKLSQKYTPSEILLTYVLAILILTLIFPGDNWVLPSKETAWLLFAVGLASTCNQLLVTQALCPH